jgi:hypothetical protein
VATAASGVAVAVMVDAALVFPWGDGAPAAMNLAQGVSVNHAAWRAALTTTSGAGPNAWRTDVRSAKRWTPIKSLQPVQMSQPRAPRLFTGFSAASSSARKSPGAPLRWFGDEVGPCEHPKNEDISFGGL